MFRYRIGDRESSEMSIRTRRCWCRDQTTGFPGPSQHVWFAQLPFFSDEAMSCFRMNGWMMGKRERELQLQCMRVLAVSLACILQFRSPGFSIRGVTSKSDDSLSLSSEPINRG